MDGALAVGSRGGTRPGHRLLLINIDDEFQFSRVWRRTCFDLFRQRAPYFRTEQAAKADPLDFEIEVWDVHDEPSRDPAERERTRVWRHWPKQIAGGPEAAAAEFDDRMADDLSEDGERLDNLGHTLVVVVAMSMADFAATGGEGARAHRLLKGIGRYFREGRHADHRRNVTIVLVVNAWGATVRRADIAARIAEAEKASGLACDVAIVSDRRLDGQNPLDDERRDSNMRLLRLVIDLMADRRIHESLANEARRSRAGGQLLLVRLKVVQDHIETRQRAYAETICGALIAVDAERSKAHVDAAKGESQFVASIRDRLNASQEIVTAATRMSDSELFKDQPDAKQDPIYARMGQPRFEEISRALNLGPRTQQALLAYLDALDRAIHAKLEANGGTLAAAEAKSVEHRQSHLVKLREKLGLEELGHGNPGKQNLARSKRLVADALDEIGGKIGAFWAEFSGRKLPARETGGLGLVQSRCPSLDSDWAEVKELGAAYDQAQLAIAELPFKPSRVLWAALAIVLFLALPLLSIAQWMVEPGRQLHLAGYAVWSMLLLIALALPWWSLRRPRQKVRKALERLNSAAAKLTTAIEGKLSRVVEYLGLIQRHRYLHALGVRLDELDRDIDYIDKYLVRVRESLDPPPYRRDAEPSADQRSVSEIVRQSGSGNAAELNSWLASALTSYRREHAELLTVRVRSGPSTVPVTSSLMARSLDIDVVDYQEPKGP